MITLYIHGTAKEVEGVMVDYIVVPETEVQAMLAVGWVKSVGELTN